MKINHVVGLLLIAAVLLAATLPVAGQDDPPPVPVDQLEVITVVDTELLTGPLRTGAFLAPSGEVFAYLGDDLCLYAVSGEQQRCFGVDADVLKRFDSENVRWSPDGRYLVLGEEALRTLRDSDLWVLDTTTGSVTNITDDGYEGRILMGEIEGEAWVDLAPRWSPDGRLMFLRLVHQFSTVNPMVLVSTAPDGSALEEIMPLPGENAQVYWFNLAPDGGSLVYNLDVYEDNVITQLFITGLDGSDTRMLTQSQFYIINATFSPDGRYLLILDSRIGQYSLDFRDPEASPIRIIDVETGEERLVDDTRFVFYAGWGPEGHALAYLTRDLKDPDAPGLYLTAEPGQPGRRVLQGEFYPPTSMTTQPIPWGANQVILLSGREDQNLRVIQLGVP